MLSKRKLRKLFGIIQYYKINTATYRFIINLIRHKIGFFKKNLEKNIPYPTTLMLELTNKCNLHCITCPREYHFGNHMDIGNMTTPLAKKIIDENIDYIQSIGLTGMGETLFANNLVEIAKYIKSVKSNVITFISTNANITDFINKIKPVLPFIDTLQISIDGTDSTYDSIRRGGVFKSFEQNIDLIVPMAQKNNVDIIFNMVVTKINYQDMINVINFAELKKIRYLNFSFFNLASTSGIDLNYYKFFSCKEFIDHLNTVKNRIAKSPDMEITGLDFLNRHSSPECPLMWNHFQVNHDGEIPPCCAKPFSKEFSFGNVSNDKLIDIINSRQARFFRQTWLNFEKNDFCSKCHFIHI